MKNYFYLLLVLFTLNSCASILNKTYTEVHVHTTEPATLVVQEDTFITFNNKKVIPLERKKQTIAIQLQTDSLSKTIQLHPKNSTAYMANIFCTYGLGLLVDRDKDKRYDYQRHVYVDLADTSVVFYKYPLEKQRQWRLHVSLPHINSYLFHPADEGRKVNTGFWGFSLGVDYYLKNKTYINITGSTVADIFVPVPAAITYPEEFETMSSVYISSSVNHAFDDRFSIGFGLAYGENFWRYTNNLIDEPEPSRPSVRKRHKALGLVVPVYYRTGNRFHFGCIYRPTFLRFDIKPTLKYEHLLSIDFAWKFNIGKKE